jgi:hypothetical protein
VANFVANNAKPRRVRALVGPGPAAYSLPREFETTLNNLSTAMKLFFTAITATAVSVLALTAAESLENTSFSGKVIETTNAASYTYVRIDTGTNKVWAAAPEFAVRIGDAVEVRRGMAMPKYHSKTLDRDFDVVYFTGSIFVAGKKPGEAATQALPAGHPPLSAKAGKTTAPVDFSGLKKPDGGKTVEEVVTGKAELKGKEVAIRARVVKYNAMVLGKNWLHIRDGSGKDGSNDLTITTDTSAKVGDTVLVKGTVGVDRDFGAGYKYAVIIENAKVTVE